MNKNTLAIIFWQWEQADGLLRLNGIDPEHPPIDYVTEYGKRPFVFDTHAVEAFGFEHGYNIPNWRQQPGETREDQELRGLLAAQELIADHHHDQHMLQKVLMSASPGSVYSAFLGALTAMSVTGDIYEGINHCGEMYEWMKTTKAKNHGPQ